MVCILLSLIMRTKHVLAVLMMLTATVAGCFGDEKTSEEEIDDVIDDVIDDTPGDSGPPGALFVYIQSEDYSFGIQDQHPLSLHFPAPPMSDGSPYALEQICSVDDGHAADVYSTWVNSSGGNAGDFNNITSWSVKNNNSIELEHFAYDPMSDIINFTNPMVVFEDNVSFTGHVEAEVFDQATWSCTDAVADPVTEEDLEDCPFDDPIASPCAEPECIADHESDACTALVDAFCVDNPEDEGCEFMAMLEVFEFMESLGDLDNDALCGVVPEMGSSMIFTSPMEMEGGGTMIMTMDTLWEYDDAGNARTRMMMTFDLGAMGEIEMGSDLTQIATSTVDSLPADLAEYPWIINLAVAITEEDSMETEHLMVILRDMEAEPLDVCPEPEEDDGGDGGSDTFWCSDEVGGSPDTAIPFEYVNDGDEDCGDGSDEPQDMDPSVDSDGDGDTTNDIDNWFDCNDGDGSTVPMDEVNDGWDDCPNGADEGGSDGGDMEVDIGLPNPDDMGCEMGDDGLESDNGSSDNGTDEEDFMPSAATMETTDDGIVYLNMTYESDNSTCDMEWVVTPDADGNMTLTSMTMSNGTATMTMETWFDVTIVLVVEESDDTDWEWAAPDLLLEPNTHSLHTFDCGESGLMEEDEDNIDNTLIIFNRVNDDTADCADQSDEAVDYDGDGVSDTMFNCETLDDITDDINMYLVNDGNMSDCPNDSDEYMQDGSSWGEFNWNSSDTTTPYGYSASLLICESMGCIMPYSGHNISADELSLEILMTDSRTDEMDLDGQCSDMVSEDKDSLSVLLSVPFDEMDWTLTGTGGDFTDANGKNWYVAYVDMNSNGLVDLGDQISLSSQDTTDLYFTCVEIHDDMSYVDMYTGETPNSMPGFTALMVSLSLVAAAFVAVRREEE